MPTDWEKCAKSESTTNFHFFAQRPANCIAPETIGARVHPNCGEISKLRQLIDYCLSLGKRQSTFVYAAAAAATCFFLVPTSGDFVRLLIVPRAADWQTTSGQRWPRSAPKRNHKQRAADFVWWGFSACLFCGQNQHAAAAHFAYKYKLGSCCFSPYTESQITAPHYWGACLGKFHGWLPSWSGWGFNRQENWCNYKILSNFIFVVRCEISRLFIANSLPIHTRKFSQVNQKRGFRLSVLSAVTQPE